MTYPGGKGIVYVLDDDAIVRGGLKDLLQSVGLQVATFGSVEEFEKQPRADGPNCLVLDVRLPGLSGLNFQNELTKSNIKTPIIFITGFGDIPMTVKAMKAGAVEFLTKPIREQDLLDAIEIALKQDQERREGDELRGRFGLLSERERAVVALVTAGKLNKQVAAEIGVSEISVKVHRRKAMQKLGARSLADLVRMADFAGLGRAKS